jgi:hypothetical protein
MTLEWRRIFSHLNKTKQKEDKHKEAIIMYIKD